MHSFGSVDSELPSNALNVCGNPRHQVKKLSLVEENPP